MYLLKITVCVVFLLRYRYKQVYKAMLQTPEVRAKVARFNDLMKTMSFYAGSNITDMFSLFYLYHTFSTQSSLGLTLPNWSKSVFPHGELLDATILQYHLFSYNNELIRLSGGRAKEKKKYIYVYTQT